MSKEIKQSQLLVAEEEATKPVKTGALAKNAVREFAPLPPLPDGDEVAIADYAERAYLEYAVSVVKGRALPEVGDGQKPVQRRILYAMRQMGLAHGNKHVKSARVVGDVLGKYHPHGDASAYDAMVRLAQDFSVRYPLIDGQGNFGSRDGDNAAAMRYTETRLTAFAQVLLSELDMGTVDYVANYDGAFKEPAMLPARLPVVLLNGASGIAVGMATEIPAHNLRELAEVVVQLIRQPEMEDQAMLDIIQGPDLPGGGQIISSPQEIRDCYRNGRGSLKMRARWQIEELARGQWQIVINELPHGVSTRKVLEEIDNLTNPKPRANKKSLTQEQTQNKQLILSVLDSLADESDKSQAVRLVLQPRSSRQSAAEMMNVLLAHTSLQNNLSVNLTMIGLDGRPQQKALTQVLREWVDFRIQTVRRRTRFRLDQVNDRLHILAGRMVVFLNLDEVIALIRESDDPKAALMARFELSERQVEDILEIRLRQLARMEGIRIEKEIKVLEKEGRALNRLLAKESALRAQVATEIEQDALTFGDERRTLIEQAQQVSLSAPVVDDPVTVIVSTKHWVRSRQGYNLDLSATSFKAGDSLYAHFECRTTDSCIIFTTHGRVATVSVAQFPSGRGDGAPLASFFELTDGARIAQVICPGVQQSVLIASDASYGFACKITDMQSRMKAGKQFVTLGEASILPPWVHTPPAENGYVVAASQQGRLLLFAYEELKQLSGGGKGVLLQGLADEDSLQAVAVITAGDSLLIDGTVGKRHKQIKLSWVQLQAYIAKRARAGKSVQKTLKIQSINVIAKNS